MHAFHPLIAWTFSGCRFAHSSSTVKCVLRLLALVLISHGVASAQADKDSDGDGLTDFAEEHKYFTNPALRDSDGDGRQDSLPEERREYSYSIRTVIRVLKPYDLIAMNDDYQDASLLRETPEYGEIEVIHYPLNTFAAAISSNTNWQKEYAAMQDWLKPGMTTNWSPELRIKLISELRAAGIDPAELSDRELAQKVSRWLLDTTRSPGYMFTTYFMDFSEGKPSLLSGCEKAYEREKGKMGWSFQQQLEHEIFGAGMFANKTRGTCTSSAIYWTTIFRALGLPARQVLCIPAVDTNDPAQLAMVKQGVTHHNVRKTMILGMEKLRGFVAHTFNEVFVGGRWVRLNYSKLGQNILDEKAYGLLTHTLTFNDLSEVKLAPTWGRRYALGQRSAEIPTSNPFTALEVNDQFGAHAQIPNPPVAPEADHKLLTIQRIIWAESEQRPSWLSLDMIQKSAAVSAIALLRPVEHFKDQDHRQYRRFLDAADPEFILKDAVGTEVKGRLTGGFYSTRTECEIALAISKDDLSRMKPGVQFTLVPKNGIATAPTWAVKEGVSLSVPAP